MASVVAETKREMVRVEEKGEEPARLLEQGRRGGQLQLALSYSQKPHTVSASFIHDSNP